MFNKNIAENLKTLRLKHNLTQSEIAFFLSIERSSYTNYELGKTEPKLESIVILSKLYNVSTDTILIEKIKKVESYSIV